MDKKSYSERVNLGLDVFAVWVGCKACIVLEKSGVKDLIFREQWVTQFETIKINQPVKAARGISKLDKT